jgi:molybdopterin-containing oxidoreductase family iron-sulfur binding subunit
MNWESVRARLAGRSGTDYWRSLDELADTPAFQEFAAREFPKEFSFSLDPLTRRTLLKAMGASLGMAFLTSCRRPLDTIIPYNQAPEDLVPGKPLFFASGVPRQGYLRGVLVETQMGRPTKIEGNPLHPDGAGTSDAFMQAAVLEMYDPDRSQKVRFKGAPATWTGFFGELAEVMKGPAARGGAGLRILTETITSPSQGDQLRRLLKKYPGARWHQYEPAGLGGVLEGARLAFGRPFETLYDFSSADVILSLDADFLTDRPGSLRYARDFASRRRAEPGRPMNRLYAVEPTPSVTGMAADHRWPLRNDQIDGLARRIAREMGVSVAPGAALPADVERWIGALLRDLKAHRGRSVVVAGLAQPPSLHALAHHLNRALGNDGKTVFYTDPAMVEPVDPRTSLAELVKDLNDGAVSVLLVLGGNPVYNAPADLNVGEALAKAGFTAHLGLHVDETAALCRWHLPAAHALESWGDGRAYDGTVTLIQPQIAPLYDGKTAGEVLSALVDDKPRSARDIVHDYWTSRHVGLDAEGFWTQALQDGVIKGSATPRRTPALLNRPLPVVSSPEGLEISFRPDPTVGDGRWANNGWLQELPKPVTKLVWDNAALIAPALAERLGLANEQVVTLTLDGRSVEAPVWIVPGQADNAVTLPLGYGRTRAGAVGDGAGFNAYALRTSENPGHGAGAVLKKTGGRRTLVATQHHFAMEGRALVREGTLAEFKNDPSLATRHEPEPPRDESLFLYSRPKASEDYAWGMGIDLSMCIGCAACVTACQAENNIPVVGKDQVAKGREMHWIRVDHYHVGDVDNPRSVSQPVPCMHCEDAPCEPVCPVAATSHSEDGLNQMTYNRCVGTRYCSNNCSYKVRRFNFFDHAGDVKGSLKLLQNPDVTVRERGVMEKCTYCVQRIQSAKLTAKKEGRLVRDGEIVPACVQTCPAQAIVFGNLKDKASRVAAAQGDPRNYSLLAHLGTRPRTTYQARVRNPNPELAS